MSLPTGSLRHNLHTLAHCCDERSLVSNTVGTRLYHSSSFWGKIWTWIYDLFPCFLDDNQVSRTIQKTLNAYERKKKEIIPFFEAYSDHSKDVDTVRYKISEFNETTYPLIKRVHKKTLSHEKINKTLLDPKFFAHQKRLKHLIDVECELQSSTPYDAHDSVVKKWIEKVDDSQLSIRKLQKALRHLENSQELFSQLHLHHCKRLLQNDPKHLKWRDSLQPGTSVFCEDRKLVIGKKYSEHDGIIYYEIQNNPQYLLCIANNQVRLNIWKNATKDQGVSIKSATIVDVDATGRCALVERPVKLLGAYKWESRSSTITDRDWKQAQSLLPLLKKILQEKKLPEDLNPRALFVDVKGEIKSLSPLAKKESFDNKVFTDFIWYFAGNNHHIFQYLMIESGFHKS